MFQILEIRGERGIRTPGASQHAGFQDRCNRPLYHLSESEKCGVAAKFGCKVRQKNRTMQIFCAKIPRHSIFVDIFAAVSASPVLAAELAMREMF